MQELTSPRAQFGEGLDLRKVNAIKDPGANLNVLKNAIKSVLDTIVDCETQLRFSNLLSGNAYEIIVGDASYLVGNKLNHESEASSHD